MALVPVVVRRRLLVRANFGGGPMINLLAFVLQPAVYLKRKSFLRGIMGASMAWKVVAAIVYTPTAFRRLFGKRPEVIDVSGLGPGRFMTINTAKPVTPRRRRKLAKQGISVPTLADRKASGQLWAATQNAARRAS